MTWEKSLKIVLGEFKVADGHREARTWGPKGIAQLVSLSSICGQDCWRRAVSSSSRLQGYGLCDENCFRYLWSTPRVFRLGEDQSIMDPPYRRGFCFKVARAVLLWVTPASHQSPDDCSSVHYFFLIV